MFLQRYVHVVLDAVLGGYIKNIDPDALKISVWNGKIEVDVVELQPEAFSLSSNIYLIKGALHHLRIDLPWTNLGNQPIRVDIEDLSLLLGIRDTSREMQPPTDKELAKQQKLQQEKLKRRRVALDALEKANELNEKTEHHVITDGANRKSQEEKMSWKQTFYFKLLMKLLDNVQLNVQHLHLRLEDQISDPKQPYAVGITLQSIIIKSTDDEWNYTMVMRGPPYIKGAKSNSASCLRKKMEINQFGLYWSIPFTPVPVESLEDRLQFMNVMRMSTWSVKEDPLMKVVTQEMKQETEQESKQEMTQEMTQELTQGTTQETVQETKQDTTEPIVVEAVEENPIVLVDPNDYIVKPLSMFLKLTINDGNAKLPLTQEEVRARVMSRLGTTWQVETINAIGDDTWQDFVQSMPKLTGNRKYTLSFVFSEAWSVALDLHERDGSMDENNSDNDENLPSLQDFKLALASCCQWPVGIIDRLDACIAKYYDAVMYVLEEKSTYLDVNTTVDDISVLLSLQQYVSCMSLLSFLSTKRWQARYLQYRPTTGVTVKSDPKAWWKYALDSVLMDVRERLARSDIQRSEVMRSRRVRYIHYYLASHHRNSLAIQDVPADVLKLTKNALKIEMDQLESELRLRELYRLRLEARELIAKKREEALYFSANTSNDGKAAESSSGSGGIWSYASWITRGGIFDNAPVSPRNETALSEEEAKELCDVIDFKPAADTYSQMDVEDDESHTIVENDKLGKEQHIWYRLRMTLRKASLQLCSNTADHMFSAPQVTDKEVLLAKPLFLKAAIDDVEVQVFVRSSSLELGLKLRDIFLCQHAEHPAYCAPAGQTKRNFVGESIETDAQERIKLHDGKHFLLQRMAMAEVMSYHPPGVREYMSSVRLRDCEDELPLFDLRIEHCPQYKTTRVPDSTNSRFSFLQSNENEEDIVIPPMVHIALVAQAIKCDVNLPFILSIVDFFSVSGNLSVLEKSVWGRAQSLQQYSRAQLRAALEQRTRVKLQLDVISPLINVVQISNEHIFKPPAENIANLLVFFGHLHATSRKTIGSTENRINEAFISSDKNQLYDVIDFRIVGVEALIHYFNTILSVAPFSSSSESNVYPRRKSKIDKMSPKWMTLLQKMTIGFSVHLSMAPSDPTLPLTKIQGEVGLIPLNLSVSSFNGLLELLGSFQENLLAAAENKARSLSITSPSNGHRGASESASSFENQIKHNLSTAKHISGPGDNRRLLRTRSSRWKAQQRSRPNGSTSDKKAKHINKVGNQVEDRDLVKLWNRVLMDMQFIVKKVVLKLLVCESNCIHEKVVVAVANGIEMKMIQRSFDRTNEFILGSCAVEDILQPSVSNVPGLPYASNERTRYLLNSGFLHPANETRSGQVDSGQLSENVISVVMVSIDKDSLLPTDKSLWNKIRPVVTNFQQVKLDCWQDPIVTQLSIDACLQTLVIHIHQDTLADLVVFFTKATSTNLAKAGSSRSLRSRSKSRTSTTVSAGDEELIDNEELELIHRKFQTIQRQVKSASVGNTYVDASDKINIDGEWKSSSYINPRGIEKKREVSKVKELDPAHMQIRLQVNSLSVFLHEDDWKRGLIGKTDTDDDLNDTTSTKFANLKAEKFYFCMQRFPNCMFMYTYLTALNISDLTILDPNLSQIVARRVAANEDDKSAMSFKESKSDEEADKTFYGASSSSLDLQKLLNKQGAMFSCAVQAFGANDIQESWHPGYCNRVTVQLKSPRIRFLYSFVDSIRRYALEGKLYLTLTSAFGNDDPETEWKGDHRLSYSVSLGSGTGIDDESIGTSSLSRARRRRTSTSSTKVVSLFPLIDISLLDVELSLPPSRLSSEALILRFDKLVFSNEYLLDEYKKLENRVIAKVLLNSSLAQAKANLVAVRIVSRLVKQNPSSSNLPDNQELDSSEPLLNFITQSLVSSTNIDVSLDFRTQKNIKSKVEVSPVKLVFNPQQCEFVLRVPRQNFQERGLFGIPSSIQSQHQILRKSLRSDSFLASASAVNTWLIERARSLSALSVPGRPLTLSEGQAGLDELPQPQTVNSKDDSSETSGSTLSISVDISEVSLEMLRHSEGYEVLNNGDIKISHLRKDHVGSICILDIEKCSFQIEYNILSGDLEMGMNVSRLFVRDSRAASSISATYRNVVVFDAKEYNSQSTNRHNRVGNDLGNVSSIIVRANRTITPMKLTSSPSQSYMEFDGNSMPNSNNEKSTSGIKPAEKKIVNISVPMTPKATRNIVNLSPNDLFRKDGTIQYNNTTTKEINTPSNEDKELTASKSQCDNREAEILLGDPESRFDISIDVRGFRIVPSNIHYDILDFLKFTNQEIVDSEPSNDWIESIDSVGHDEDQLVEESENLSRNGQKYPVSERLSIIVKLGPSSIVLVENPIAMQSRGLALSWEASLNFGMLRPINVVKHHVHSTSNTESHQQNQIRLSANITNLRATSRLAKDGIRPAEDALTIEAADCLQPIGIQSVLYLDLVTDFLRWQINFDRIMELRFGYVDFCTVKSAIEKIMVQPKKTSGQYSSNMHRQRSLSSSSLMSMGSSSSSTQVPPPQWLSTSRKSNEEPDIKHQISAAESLVSEISPVIPLENTAIYGQSVVQLMSASCRGRLQGRPVVGFYDSPWKKRYLLLPFNSEERQLVTPVMFRILPARGSERVIGEPVYFGDRIMLQAAAINEFIELKKDSPPKSSSPSLTESRRLKRNSSNPIASNSTPAGDVSQQAGEKALNFVEICQYNQLGATGYLGPDGTAGVFETTIWQHGTTAANADKTIVLDRDLVVFEDLSLYWSLQSTKHVNIARSTALSSSSTININNTGGGNSATTNNLKDPNVRDMYADIRGVDGGGYLMYNGVGDAPIPFELLVVPKNSMDLYIPNSKKESENTTKKSGVSSFIMDRLRVIDFSMEGVNATIVNDFHNMLLPLLHFRAMQIKFDLRGSLSEKFTAIGSLQTGLQIYNSQLAVWEPLIEDFVIHYAYHGKGGVLCDYCMSQRVPASASAGTRLKNSIECAGLPTCLFQPSRTAIFTDTVVSAAESKHFLAQECLKQVVDHNEADASNTFLVVLKSDLNLNISRNAFKVLEQCLILITKANELDRRANENRLGPYIYVDNQTGIPFLVANHPSPSVPASNTRQLGMQKKALMDIAKVPTFHEVCSDGEDEFEVSTDRETKAEVKRHRLVSREISRRKLSTFLQDVAASETAWKVVESGRRIPTDTVAHEAPAGCVTSPLRRMLWLKPKRLSSKTIPVPIGYSNRSYLYLESSDGDTQSRDVWHGRSIICETVAEQGTLVLRLRGKIQFNNWLAVPIEINYNDGERVERVENGVNGLHYVPIELADCGNISIRPILPDGRLRASENISIPLLVEAPRHKMREFHRSQTSKRHGLGEWEKRHAMSFYWDVHPKPNEDLYDENFSVSRPPFQVIVTIKKKAEHRETVISFRTPIQLENLLPYDLMFQTVCLKSKKDIEYVESNTASFSGSSGYITSGSVAHVSELEVFSSGYAADDINQMPSTVAIRINLKLPTVSESINNNCSSQWNSNNLIYGSTKFCDRIQLELPSSLDENEELDKSLRTLTICVDVIKLEVSQWKSLNVLAPVRCRLFVEYWLLDRTGLNLSFYTTEGRRIQSHNPQITISKTHEESSSLVKESSTSLSIFTPHSQIEKSDSNMQHLCKVKIGIPKSKHRSHVKAELMSDLFDIGAVGVSGQISLAETAAPRTLRGFTDLIPRLLDDSAGSYVPMKRYEFGVINNFGPGKFSRSKVVAVVPRYFIVNSSSHFNVHVRQQGSSVKYDMVLQPKERRVFHWNDGTLPSRVQVRFVQSKISGQVENHEDVRMTDSEWSHPFELSTVGNFVMRLRNVRLPAPTCFGEHVFDARESIATHSMRHPILDNIDFSNTSSLPVDLRPIDELHLLASRKAKKLNVAIELHDPSIFINLEEASIQESKEEENDLVAFKIQNLCGFHELYVWQKATAGSEEANSSIATTVGFEGGDCVLPFHTIDYIPYTSTEDVTLFIQVQQLIGIVEKKNGKKKKKHFDQEIRNHWGADSGNLDGLHTETHTQIEAINTKAVVATFEVNLNKLGRLPVVHLKGERADKSAVRRLWMEVRLDKTAKTLVVTDMLPGSSLEHNRRRRAALIRTWKVYNTSLLWLSQFLNDNTEQRETHGISRVLSLKQKTVRFADDHARVEMSAVSIPRSNSDEENLHEIADNGSPGIEMDTEAHTAPLSLQTHQIIVCMQIIQALNLEELYLRNGVVDITSCRPILFCSLRVNGVEKKESLYPQSSAIFPRWIPEITSAAVGKSCLRIAIPISVSEPKSNELYNEELVIQIREPDRMLFGTTLMGTITIPLAKYFAAIRRKTIGNIRTKNLDRGLPQVLEVVAPVILPTGKSKSSSPSQRQILFASKAVVQVAMCCEFVRDDTTIKSLIKSNSKSESEDEIRLFQKLQRSLLQYHVKGQQKVLGDCKAGLKKLLETESIDVSVGKHEWKNGRLIHHDHKDAHQSNEIHKNYVSIQLPQFGGKGNGSPSLTSGPTSISSESGGSETSSNTGYDYSNTDDHRLSAVLIGVTGLCIDTITLRKMAADNPNMRSVNFSEQKLYCTMTFDKSTRSVASVVAKPAAKLTPPSELTKNEERMVRTMEFPRGHALGLDLVYQEGRVVVQGVVCASRGSELFHDGKIRIGDTIVAVNRKSIVNLHQEATFKAIEQARTLPPLSAQAASIDEKEDKVNAATTFTLSFLYRSMRGTMSKESDENNNSETCRFDAEWNQRVDFRQDNRQVDIPDGLDPDISTRRIQSTLDKKSVLVRCFLRSPGSEHGLSTAQEPGVVPLLYFFGDDPMMDKLDHRKQESRFDVLLAEAWVPVPDILHGHKPFLFDEGAESASANEDSHVERICALYSPIRHHHPPQIIGQLRLALKWETISQATASQQPDRLDLYCQLEIARICVSVIDDRASSASSSNTPSQEVLCISLSDRYASAGVQIIYGRSVAARQALITRIGHFQIDNQLLDTNYPVLLHPVRRIESESANSHELRLQPTFHMMAVYSNRQREMIQFESIFVQLQELQIQVEDAILVTVAQVFGDLNWTLRSPTRSSSTASYPLNGGILRTLEEDWWLSMTTLTPNNTANNAYIAGQHAKILIRWMLLCPVKVNVTFTSTTDRSQLLALLSPSISLFLRTLISTAAALVSNLDHAPITIPEIYAENMFKSTHTLVFYIMQHYLRYGLRSWYTIMGSIDFLGNPIGLMSTLGTGLRDFFYTPAHMLLEHGDGLNIGNLREGMTEGSKSLFRNTAVGIFHTTGKITETLGKGIALLALDDQYTARRQRQEKIADFGDGLTVGSKGFVGGVIGGVEGIVKAPLRGVQEDGAAGLIVGIGKGFAGLIAKPTAGVFDLLTSLSRGAKSSAESIDGQLALISRFRTPRRICSDNVLVSYSDREARGYAVLLLTGLDVTDDYVYHVDYGLESLRGLVFLTDKRIVCLAAKTGQRLWEIALDSSIEIHVSGLMLSIVQTTRPKSKTYNIECDSEAAASNFKTAHESSRMDLSSTRYLLLNLEHQQQHQQWSSSPSILKTDKQTQVYEETDFVDSIMEKVHDSMTTGLTEKELQDQPIRSVRVELCHLGNKDAHAKVPARAIDSVFSFSVFQIQVYGGPYQWTVYRRFNEFRALYAALEHAGQDMKSLPPLPTRTFLPSTREAIAKSRLEALGMCLQTLIMHSSISRSPIMLEFLTRQAHESRVSLPPLSPTIVGGNAFET